MPEGDTLFKLAEQLRPALLGKPLVRAEFPRLAGDPSLLHGQRITAVDAKGKNLLVRFEGGLTLHTHLKLNGSWHLYRPGESWKRPASAARAVLEVADAQAVCFDAPVVRLLREQAERRDPLLSRLGPDLLAADFSLELACARVRQLDAWPLGEAVMHQGAVAGIGNVYKSEVLFLEQFDPFEPVRALDEQALGRLLERARALLLANVGQAAPARRVTREASPTQSARLWVYRRRAQPCFRCGTAIRMKRQGATQRSTYFCPTCQHVSATSLARLFPAPLK